MSGLQIRVLWTIGFAVLVLGRFAFDISSNRAKDPSASWVGGYVLVDLIILVALSAVIVILRHRAAALRNAMRVANPGALVVIGRVNPGVVELLQLLGVGQPRGGGTGARIFFGISASSGELEIWAKPDGVAKSFSKGQVIAVSCVYRKGGLFRSAGLRIELSDHRTVDFVVVDPLSLWYSLNRTEVVVLANQMGTALQL